MKRILVTGVGGQIGRFLVRRFLQDKVSFIGLDIRHDNHLSDFDLLRLEITNRADLEKNRSNLETVDTLVHLASKIDENPDIIKSGRTSIELNLIGTLNLLEFLPNLRHVCYTSSYMVYGTPTQIPISENHSTNPNSVYGASKLATEKFLQVFAEQKNIDLSILRVMGVYGLEKPHNQAIPSFIKMIATDQSPVIIGNGEIKRNHIFISDVIESIMMSLKNSQNGVYNIGGVDAPSNLDLIRIINEKLGKNVKPVFKESKITQYDFITDIKKAQDILKFRPRVKIEDGISKTIERYLTVGW